MSDTSFDYIVIGGGTLRSDTPRLDVRLPGLEARSPERWVLTRGSVPEGWHALHSPAAISAIASCMVLAVACCDTGSVLLRKGSSAFSKRPRQAA